MLIGRRGFVGGLGAAALCGGCQRQQAQGPYPSRDISFVIPTGAGGGADIYARLIGSAMEEHLPEGVNVVPVNIPSGGGGKGVLELFRAKPDGYTIGILNIPGIFVLQRLRKMPYDFTDFTWLGSLTNGEHYGLAVGWDSPVRSLADLQRLGQRRQLTFATTGPEGTSYTATQISTRILDLPNRLVAGYKGSSDYVVAAMRGDSAGVVAAITTLQRLLDAKTVRILASFDESSAAGIPNAQTLNQPDLALLSGERVIAGPPGMPEDLRQMVATALSKAWSYKPLPDWSRGIGETIAPKTPEQTEEMVRHRLAFLDRWLASNA